MENDPKAMEGTTTMTKPTRTPKSEPERSQELSQSELGKVAGGMTIARQTPKTDFGDRMKAGLD